MLNRLMRHWSIQHNAATRRELPDKAILVVQGSRKQRIPKYLNRLIGEGLITVHPSGEPDLTPAWAQSIGQSVQTHSFPLDFSVSFWAGKTYPGQVLPDRGPSGDIVSVLVAFNPHLRPTPSLQSMVSDATDYYDLVIVSGTWAKIKAAAIASMASVWLDCPVGPVGPVVDAPANYNQETPPLATPLSQVDVLQQIRANDAWKYATGAGVTIAVVDSGVDANTGLHRHQLSEELSYGPPWEDPEGHGSMCASIAAGSRSLSEKWNGVAPNARVLSLSYDRRLFATLKIYSRLVAKLRANAFPGGLVISNSWGILAGQQISRSHPLVAEIEKCMDLGAIVCFAAGNSHNGNRHCSPGSIYAFNGMKRVITIGTVNRDLTNCASSAHRRSSRGPGSWAHHNHVKPDIVAPTYGIVRYGSTYKEREWWGTSGACPQVAGVAALLLELRPELTQHAVGSVLRKTARGLPGLPWQAVGHGVVDALAAVQSVKP